MTTNTAAPFSTGASWELQSTGPNPVREGEASPKYNSHLDLRTPSPVVQSEYVGGARPPTKATAIFPYLPLKSDCVRNNGEYALNTNAGDVLCFGVRLTATRSSRVVRREKRQPTGRSCEEGVVLMLKWKWVGLYGHTLPTSLRISS